MIEQGVEAWRKVVVPSGCVVRTRGLGETSLDQVPPCHLAPLVGGMAWAEPWGIFSCHSGGLTTVIERAKVRGATEHPVW